MAKNYNVVDAIKSCSKYKKPTGDGIRDDYINYEDPIEKKCDDRMLNVLDAIDDSRDPKPTEGWEGCVGGHTGRGGASKKLSDLENDLYYTKRTPFITLTKDDFTFDENGNASYVIDRSSVGAYTGFGFDMHEVYVWEDNGETFSGEYSGTEKDESEIFVNHVNNIKGYWHDDAYMEIVDGGTYSWENDEYVESNVIQIILPERGGTASLELTLYLIDEKKIPFECIAAPSPLKIELRLDINEYIQRISGEDEFWFPEFGEDLRISGISYEMWVEFAKAIFSSQEYILNGDVIRRQNMRVINFDEQEFPINVLFDSLAMYPLENGIEIVNRAFEMSYLHEEQMIKVSCYRENYLFFNTIEQTTKYIYNQI